MAELRFSDSHTSIYLGNSLHMAELTDNSVHCCVCSPPYWGQRVYKGAQELVWGGDDCEHEWSIRKHNQEIFQTGATGRGSPTTTIHRSHFTEGICQKCGAWRGAYGLEPTPEMWIEHTLMFLREIRRVLRKDGIVWFNVDDKRWGSGSGTHDYREQASISKTELYQELSTTTGKHKTIKPLDLCLIPQRLAIAAQEDGWYVRSVVMWEKLNPMPESISGTRWERCKVKVKSQTYPWAEAGSARAAGPSRNLTDSATMGLFAQWADCPGCPKCEPNDGVILRRGSWRPTESYETILMLTKSDKYFADQEAVREVYTEPLNRWGGNDVRNSSHKYIDSYEQGGDNSGIGAFGRTSMLRAGAKTRSNEAGRNLRDVWRFSTQGYAGPHFSTFPEKLPEICIKASTSEKGVCPKCGAQYARVVKPGEDYEKLLGTWTPDTDKDKDLRAEIGFAAHGKKVSTTADYQTLGWRPTCNCNAGEPIPAVVLDPFVGTGTTLWVAKKLGRRGVGYDISEDYMKLAIERTRQDSLL